MLDEDHAILEALHRGLHADGPVARHGAGEAQPRRVALLSRTHAESLAGATFIGPLSQAALQIDGGG